MNTCTNDAIIATEKMSCGSERTLELEVTDHAEWLEPSLARWELPVRCISQERTRRTRCLSVCIPIAQLVPRMMNVLSRSRAESTNDAVRDIELE